MDNFFRISIVMEMLIVNLFAVDLCATKKYSRLKCYASLACFSFVLTFFTYSTWPNLGFDRGNAAFALIGVVFLVPLAFLYREPLHHLLSILFSAWIYTLLIYCIAVRLAYLGPGSLLLGNTLLAQSLLYILTLVVFLKWIRNGFLFILHNISQGTRYLLQCVSLSWFLSIIVINADLIYSGSRFLKLLSIITLSADSVLIYLLIYSMVSSHREVKNLESIVYTDNLTGLSNRAGLFKDAPLLIRKRTPFRLLFMDLNHFKQINDRYGHSEGDRYLVCFAGCVRSLLSESEELYRMSGDEFIILSRAGDYRPLTEKLLAYRPGSLSGMDIPFLGYSVGWADYPEEETSLDKLIQLADHRMYQNKPHHAR